MRDLEQAKAEVFRRSNARIKKRKAIGRSILACCVPLVLCIGFWSVTILPAMMPAKASNSAESAILNNINGLAPEAEIDCEAIQDHSLISASGEKAVILVHGEEYSLSDEDGAALLDIVKSLRYNPHKVCRCLPQFKFEIGSKSYGLHLREGYARCDKGQANLTEDQIQEIREILSRNKIEIN